MLKNSRKSYSGDEIRKCDREYFIVYVDYEIEGIAICEKDLQFCLGKLAVKHQAEKIGKYIYKYKDGDRDCIIIARPVNRIKKPRESRKIKTK